MEVLKGSKMTDISRPLNDSFRHTGHGSVLGNSWGNPTFLDPKYMGDDKNAVSLRGERFYIVSILFTLHPNERKKLIKFIFWISFDSIVHGKGS